MRNVHTFHSNPLLRIHFSFRKCWFSSKMHHRKSWFKTKSSQEKSCFRFAWNMFDRHSLFKIKLLQLKTLLQIKSFAFYLASNPKNACRKYTLLRIHFFFLRKSCFKSNMIEQNLSSNPKCADKMSCFCSKISQERFASETMFSKNVGGKVL